MEAFCQKPSRKKFQKLPLPIQTLFYQYSQEILQSKRNGKFRLAHRICAYYENQPLRMAVIVPDFWRRTVRHEDGWEYDQLSKDVILYRAGKTPIMLTEQQPTYFAIEVGNANQYLPTKKAGSLMVFVLKKPVRLFRLDSLSNINRLLRQLYHTSQDLYDVVVQMFVPPLLKQYKKLYESTIEKTDPIQLSRLIRYSLIPNDFRFANWLCQNGFDGYSAGVMDIYVGMGRVGKEFPEEVLLCDPPTVLRTVGQLQTTKKTSRETLDTMLDEFLLIHHHHM